REAGSQALDEANTASAAFHSSGDQVRSADAYVQTLIRIFHESVALRALREEDPSDQGEIDKVVKGLAAALRSTAKGSALVVPGALARTASFGEWVQSRRARERSDPESLRRVAILGQVRRCLDRIAVAVRTAGLFAVAGVQAPVRLPRAA